MQFNDKLRKLRKKQGYSQEELAEKLNVSRQSVSKWESGTSTPEIQKILLLCDLFQVSTDDLLRNSPHGYIDYRSPDDHKETSPFFLRWLHNHNREVLIIMAFLITVSLYLNINYRTTLQQHYHISAIGLSSTYDHFMRDVHFFRGKSGEFLQNGSSVDPGDLLVYSEGITDLNVHHTILATIHLGRQNDENIKSLSSFVNGISHSIQWFAQAAYDIHSLDEEQLERVQEFIPLLDEVLLATDEYQSAFDADDSFSLIEDKHRKAREKVLELMLLSYFHGTEPDQIHF